LGITFTAPVTGFDLADVTLTREGSNVPLSGASLSTSDNQSWAINGLDAVTDRAGSYVISLNSSGTGIQGAASTTPITGGASRPWKMNTIYGTAASDVIKL